MNHNEDAMSIGAAAFGLFCLFAVVVGIFYVVAVTSQQTPYVDSYGNTLDSTSNRSQQLVTDSTATVGPYMIPLLLIGAVILILIVIAALWVASKGFG